MISIGRGAKPKKIKEEELLKESISSYFCNIVTSPYKQDVSCLMVGHKGTGKSYASLSIAWSTAEEISKILGGTPNDYFNIDHCAIVDPDMANDLITRCEKNCCYVYDDIGLGWNARKWQSDSNTRKNDIFQINRIDQTLQLFSVPNQFLLDKIPRSLVSHYMETDRQFFSKGFITVKLFKPRTLFRESKIIQPYVATDRSKFVLYAIPAPPKKLSEEYDKLRYDITKKIIKDRAEQESIPKKTNIIKQTKDNMYERIQDALPKYNDMLKKGIGKRKALKELGIPPSTWKYWENGGYV